CRIVRNLSLNLRRDEFRRQSRERQAMAQLDSAPETLPDWEQLRPLLDEAMTELSEIDYDAIVLRFYQKQDLRSVGRTLGLSDDAAQKRVSRAVERLRESFAKRGVTIGAGGLVAAISANAVQAAPAGLAATISAAAVLAAATLATTTAVTTSATATATAAASKTIVMTALQKAAIVTLLVAAVGTGIYQVRHPAPKREPKPAPPPEQAAQVETAPLEGRPDDSPNLEPTDPAPAAQIEVVVQTSDGLPISNAKVRILAEQTSGKSPDRIDRTQITDAKGGTRISYPPAQDLERLEIAASHEDYGGLKMCWEMRAGDSIPASYTFKLGNGITIGGRVMDESDAPIAGANLSLRRFWLGGEDIVRRGEQSDFASRSTRSDAQGLWQVKGVPTDLLDHIDIRASHPDYVETEYSGGSDGMDQQLRAGTSKVTLRRGPWVAGRVIDESGNPIAGATVTAGKYNNQGTQETKTDTRGAFGFRNLSLGEIQFGALAKGWEPEIRTVEVKPDMPEILFRLGPGQKVWGIVKTEAGEPLAGVRISLESKIGGVSDTYELALDSDQDGRFEWDGAPDEVQNFCFLKMGYEAKRSQTLKPSEENVITLRQARKIEGRVLDATTEQPLTKFRVGIGRYSGADTFYADYPGMRECADTNGRFSLGASEEETGAVKAEADDYASQIERLPAAQNGVVQVVLRLKPSAALRGCWSRRTARRCRAQRLESAAENQAECPPSKMPDW
ncbi:MAG: carboxypeptidase regulatory-like domain-containing protein, partial [Verrucomicrobia bacterium]|nr:carboxypeptidase regulatory-like domain-containing protein [Verrucomicrobiota bacterium]